MANSAKGARHSDFRFNVGLLCLSAAVLVWSGINPHERSVWCLEVIPVAAGGLFLTATYHRYRFTRVTYAGIFAIGVLICMGGHWTFSRVPIGRWAQETFELSRNHFDRVSHFMQGVVSGLLMRELVLRRSGVRRGRWLFLLVSSSSLALSAMFEFVEWFVAITIGDGTPGYLAIQGDAWDAHWDMMMAFIGSIIVQMALASVQDRQLRERGLALDR